MHESSFEKMRHFRDSYLADRISEPLTIYDLGSLDVNGSYFPLFDEAAWNYKGIDMAPGPNVDIVLKNPYIWEEIKSKKADVVISGQAFEHIQYFWVTMLEIARVLKPGGLCCVIAPSSGYEHRYPVDCYRFYKDGFTALAHYARLQILENSVQKKDDARYKKDDSNVWKDAQLICRKPFVSWFASIKSDIRRYILHRAHIFCK
jgi:SAM-dependent methyltransferase